MVLIYHNDVFAKTTTNYMNNFNFAVQSIRISGPTVRYRTAE